MKYLLGIDGGGTKTDLVLCDTAGHVLARGRCGGSNLNDLGAEGCFEVLEPAIRALLSKLPEQIKPDFCFCGLSGASVDPQKRADLVQRLLTLCAHARVESDIRYVLELCLGEGDGIAMIAGTGSVAVFRENGEMRRAGGWGHLLEEGGSGYSIGKDAVKAALADYDGLGAPTLLRPLLEQKLGTDIFSSIALIYRGGKHLIASFAPLVSEAAEQGDEIALEIIVRNAACIVNFARQVQGLINGAGNDIYMMGGLVRDKLLRRAIDLRAGELCFHYIQAPQVLGAVRMAAREAGLCPDEHFDECFRATLEVAP